LAKRCPKSHVSGAAGVARLSQSQGGKTMRDHLDMKAWADHHHQFDRWVAGAAAALGRHAAPLRRVPPQLIAGTFALGITLLTLGGSAA
jgi:hypothetical protein